MKVLLAVFALVGLLWSPAFAADRLTDKDVKGLVDKIYEGRDRFEDQLDGKLKDATLRGQTGEVKVRNVLEDLQENVDVTKDRMKPEYAASNEVATLLRQATSIDRYLKTQPAGLKGVSEWNRLAVDLKALAVAYGADFPLPDGASVRRMGDKEVATILDAVAESGDKLKNSLDAELKKDTTVAPGNRESIVKAADDFTKDAKIVRDRVKDEKPSSAELERLMNKGMAMDSILKAQKTPQSSGIWATITPKLQQLAGAYAMPWPATR